MNWTTCLLVICLGAGLRAETKLNDPDYYRTSTELIESRGFISETHTVVTEDHYILVFFRIVNPYHYPYPTQSAPPVIIWHGLGASSDTWLVNRPGYISSDGVYREDNSTVVNDCRTQLTSTLPYTLAACGYDVWMANSRGNEYSNKHVFLDESSPEYNQYTITDLALYDIPPVISYILRETGRDSLSYIGHSMATTTMFVLLSLRPEFERYLNVFIALSPVAFFTAVRTNYKQLAPIEPLLRSLAFPLGLDPIEAQVLGTTVCGNPATVDICVQILAQTNGDDPYNTDKERFGIYVANSFDKISSRVYLQYAQCMNTNRFKQFDYPTHLENYQKYGQFDAPDYPVQDINSTNIVMIYGDNDYLSDPIDIQILVHRMTVQPRAIHRVSWPTWNHIDPQWAIHANVFINPIILDTLPQDNDVAKLA